MSEEAEIDVSDVMEDAVENVAEPETRKKTAPKKALKPRESLFPDPVLLRHIVEGAILAAAKPLSIEQIRELFEEHERPTADEVRTVLEDLRNFHQKRGFELREIGSGWRFQVVQDVAPWVSRMWEEKPQRYSRAVLETLALIAYRQPITRGDIEEIRGVQVASNIIKTLQERDWVRVVGHKDVPGRPALFATTRKFLDYFNLKSLDELPSLAELRDLETLNHEMVFDTPAVPTSLPLPAEEADEEKEEAIYEKTELHEGEVQALDSTPNEDAQVTVSNMASAEATDTAQESTPSVDALDSVPDDGWRH